MISRKLVNLFSPHRYEFYFDVILRGQYTFHIRDLHTNYGPVIRINPYELHISDPYYYETLYATSASGEKRDKWEWYAKQFGSFDSTFATIRHDHHKARRAALARHFSMASVRKLQPVLEKKVQRLIERIRGFKGADGDVLVVDHAFSAFTTGELSSSLSQDWARSSVSGSSISLTNDPARCCHGIFLWSFGQLP